MKLHDFQQKAIDDLTEAALAGKKRLLLVLPTGAGKTVVAANIIKHAISNGNKVLFLCHRRELIYQATARLESAGIGDVNVMLSGDFYVTAYPVTIASIATMYSWVIRKQKEGVPKADLVIVDECFPGRTLIDGRRIETISVGDFVCSFNHAKQKIETRRVSRTFSREYAGDWIMVTDSSGREFVCTDSHPIWTNEYGYIPARTLLTLNGEMVTLIINGLPLVQKERPTPKGAAGPKVQILRHKMLWDGVPRCPEKEHCEKTASTDTSSFLSRLWEWCRLRTKKDESIQQNWASVLFCRMFKDIPFAKKLGINEENKHKGQRKNSREDEEEQSIIRPQGAGDNKSKIGWQNISIEGREWETNKPTDCIAQLDGTADGICYPNEYGKGGICEPAELLQGGFGGPIGKTGNRGGRPIPPNEAVEIFGPQKNGNPKFSRVASVEIYKRGSGERPEWVPKHDTVHNIEVEENSNYFASGVLVHNCHHQGTSKTWQRILSLYPEAIVVGLTATPISKGGKGLGAHFDALIQGPSIAQLTKDGFLVPAEYFCPSIPDLQGIKIQNGDYSEKQLEERMNKPKLVGDIVENWSRIAGGRKTIVFASGVKHSIHLAEQFNSLGIKAAHVDGNTPGRERDKIFQDFEKGDTQVLANCGVATEGYDNPSVSCLVFARPTKSLGLYLQIAGRVLRTFPGKKNAFILDHSGVIYEHGMLTEERNWELEYRDADPKEIAAKRKKREKQNITCKKCCAVYTGMLTCPYCGTKPEVKGKHVETFEGYLQALDEVEMEKIRALEPDKKTFYLMLLHYARSRGKRDGMAYFKFVDKFKEKPPWSWKELQPIEPFLQVLAWIKSQNIRYAMKNRGPLKPKDRFVTPGGKVTSHGWALIDNVAQNGYAKESEETT